MKQKLAQVAEKSNQIWPWFHKHGVMTVPKNPIVHNSSKVFTIGSCFAHEVRKCLASRNIALQPDYKAIKFSADTALVDSLPENEHIAFYNTFSIQQEIERAAGLWQQDEDDFWVVEGGAFGGTQMYQDPYRRAVFAKSRSVLTYIQDQINTQFQTGFEQADLFFITLGLIEVWRQKSNGKFVNQAPGYQRGAGGDETEFYLSSFAENLESLSTTLEIIQSRRPGAKVVITVSPVPLFRTFTGSDIIVANTESKSLLRAVAGEVCRTFSCASYFPSYELMNLVGPQGYIPRDGRHVEPAAVDKIMELFLESHMAE